MSDADDQTGGSGDPRFEPTPSELDKANAPKKPVEVEDNPNSQAENDLASDE